MLQEPENWKEEFMVFAHFYLKDFPNFTGLAGELDLWYNFWDEKIIKITFLISATLKRVDA